MTKLAELRRRLSRLGRRRHNARLGAGFGGLAIAVLCILAAAFLVDWLLALNRLQRVISLLLCGSLSVWAFRHYTLPWLRRRESHLDMALLVEQQQSIDSDLIAAIQFETPDAPSWGSTQLEQAVIDRAASVGKRIDVMRGLDRRGLRRRLLGLIFVSLIWLTAGIVCPQHVAVFFHRFFLGSLHYPSRTVIGSIVVNGRAVDPQFPGRTPIRVVCGQSVRFEVSCAGQLPGGAEVQLTAVRDGLNKTILLAPVPEQPGVYAGQLPQLGEDAAYRIVMGDAWTDAGRLIVGQLPALEIRLEVVPPLYAGTDSAPLWMPAGLRQVAVMEGSRVFIHLSSDKELKEATASIAGQSYPLIYRDDPAAGRDTSRSEWVLEPADGTPLGLVRAPVRFAIQITDADDQQLERPLEGMVRIRADAPPRVAATVVTRQVLPAATPTVYIRAADDYGLAWLALGYEVARADGQSEEREIPIYTLLEGQPPQKSIARNYAFDLGPLKLSKGDSVKVVIRAVSFRGQQEGKSAASDPLVLQVTDEQGVLAAMLEADKQSVAELNDIIQRQLGIGESP